MDVAVSGEAEEVGHRDSHTAKGIEHMIVFLVMIFDEPGWSYDATLDRAQATESYLHVEYVAGRAAVVVEWTP